MLKTRYDYSDYSGGWDNGREYRNPSYHLSTPGILLTVGGVLDILSSGLLMYGSLEHNPTAPIVCLVLASLTFIFWIVVLAFAFGLIMFGGINVLVNAYSLLWVFHFYKELKSGVINNAQNA